MKVLDNKLNKIGDEIKDNISKGSKVSIIASYFSIYAFKELKKELSKVDELRFIFTEPSFLMENYTKNMTFTLENFQGEKLLSGNKYELKLRKDKEYLHFSQEDLKLKHNRNEIHWRNDLDFCRKKLVEDNYIDGSIKNNWRITEEGKQYLIKLCIEILNPDISEYKKLSRGSINRARKILLDIEIKENEELIKTFEEIGATLNKTDREQFTKMRVGQGIFKTKLLLKNNKCEICGIIHIPLLIASHIKPWKECNDKKDLMVTMGYYCALVTMHYLIRDILHLMIMENL
jgi:hypothetical protein